MSSMIKAMGSDGLWEFFWDGGLTNPLDVIEQMTYLMFIRDLDDADNLHIKESAAWGLHMRVSLQKKCRSVSGE